MGSALERHRGRRLARLLLLQALHERVEVFGGRLERLGIEEAGLLGLGRVEVLGILVPPGPVRMRRWLVGRSVAGSVSGWIGWVVWFC